jgi:Beta-galactosidase trimerisation domain
MGNRPVAAVTASYSRSGRIMWRNVTGEPAEAECRMAQTAAAGGIVWYHWLGLEQGFKEDRRWQKVGRDFLSWHARYDKHFQNLRSLAKVAILAAPKSNTLYDAPSPEEKTDSIEGMYAVLVEARIPFDFVHEEDVSEERLSPYSVVILPNVALLSDAQCRVLEEFAERGGSLLATFETGLYDETGKPRADFALGRLFGISKAGLRERSEYKTTQPIWSVHLQKIWQRNAITAGFEDTEWIAGPVWSVPLAPVQNPTMTFINPYPTYPTEAVYMREPPTNLPSIVLREKGGSRLAYLPGDMDASYWRLDNWDLGRQLMNTIQWLLGDKSTVRIEGEGLMEVFAWETEPGFALHMVNYNGPNAYRGKMRRPITLGPQTVRFELPRKVTIKKASLLRAEMPLAFQQNERVVEFTVAAVGLYEVVALEV